MSISLDIQKLFARFGGDAASYHEINRETDAINARARWPLLARVDISQPEPAPALLSPMDVETRTGADAPAPVSAPAPASAASLRGAPALSGESGMPARRQPVFAMPPLDFSKTPSVPDSWLRASDALSPSLRPEEAPSFFDADETTKTPISPATERAPIASPSILEPVFGKSQTVNRGEPSLATAHAPAPAPSAAMEKPKQATKKPEKTTEPSDTQKTPPGDSLSSIFSRLRKPR